MEQILVSACLLGLKTRFDGSDACDSRLMEFKERFIFIPVCPEILGGLWVPRKPATIEPGDGAIFWEDGGKVILKSGEEITSNFRSGAERTVAFAKFLGISRIILKEGSPSCGVTHTNISFTREPGVGIATYLLRKQGFEAVSVEEFLLSLSW